jgi:transcriptional regulator with GAF, ATPase, and Fis domain
MPEQQKGVRNNTDTVTEPEAGEGMLSSGLRVSVVTGVPHGASVTIGRSGVRIGSAPDNDLVLSDRRVSRSHLELLPHPGGVRIRDLGSRNGTFLAGVRISDVVAPPGSVVSLGDCELLVAPDQITPELPLMDRERLGGLVGRRLPMRRLFTVLERVSPTDYTVLIEGETGTGKEVVARTVHELSARRDGPFVVFDCAATTESILESELFGHVRGAFTGAVAAREGAFRRAHGGTLFIDEVSSLPPSLQGKLLRALETRQIHPVGADHEIDVDLRVVAATNRSLQGEVRAGRFRDDLYFRMSVIRVALPPLRERREDVALLAEHFLRIAGIKGEVGGPNLDRLVGYAWPGNVRELRNTLERAVALAGSREVPFADLPIVADNSTPTLAWPILLDLPFKDAKDHLVDAFERVYATRLLDQTGGNVSEAARRSKISRRYLFVLIKKHRLRAGQEIADDIDDDADDEPDSDGGTTAY